MPPLSLIRKLMAAGLASATLGCKDTLRPDPTGEELPAVTAAYVCGNDFDLISRHAAELEVRYRISGTGEDGALLLPARTTDSTPSTTRLTTIRTGTLRLWYGEEELPPVGNAGMACSGAGTEPGLAARQGQWTAPFYWPIVAVHLHLLPGGEVLSWGREGDPQVWDAETGTFTPAPSSTMLFCGGHAFLPDGRLIVTGGHISEDHGLPDANIFDPLSRSWTPITAMSRGRWYPTSTTLENGEVLTLAGRDENGDQVEVPEVWTGSAWRGLPGAGRPLPYYPRAFVAPNGLVFYAGELQRSAYLDPRGSGEWTAVAASNYGQRDYGSAVMYRPGLVMILGGSDDLIRPPTNTAEVIDLNVSDPVWRYTQPMNHARRHFNATLLPDGSVLATGGTSAAGFSDPAGGVRAAEAWDPATETWKELARSEVIRVYHSTTLLLPDGRILHTGSGDGANLPRELNAEIFSPPYLFRGPRPLILEAPAAVLYGQSFYLATPDAPQVVRATLVRLGSVTHGFDQNQRFLELSLQRAAGGLTVTAPSNGRLAPPGDYLLFILNGRGIPSVAKVVRIG